MDEVGVKDVPVHSTGHEKQRVTVMLTAKADGTKLRPFLLLSRKRPIKELEKFRGKLIIKYEGTNWMNDSITESYIKEVIDKNLFGRRLLVWDSFKCHISPKAFLPVMSTWPWSRVAVQNTCSLLTSAGTNRSRIDSVNSTTHGWRTAKKNTPRAAI